MADANRNYCLQRADEERQRAAASPDPETAGRHRTLAGLYELWVNDPAAWAALSSQKSA